jgi:hypothetical protein
MKINKYLLKATPYLISILVGLIFYFIGLNLSENIRGLFTSLSAAFFAIPLIYLFYQVSQNLSQKRLNKEIFDYAKMQVDREVLSIINQLHKIVYTLGERDFSDKGINKFLSLEKKELKELLSKNEYLGFQIFKEWETIDENLQDILRNSFILDRLGDDQIISIILVFKSLRALERIQKNERLYSNTDKEATSYRIVSTKELSERNVELPDRRFLLEDLGDNKSRIVDFGDFPSYRMDKLLNLFAVNGEYLEAYAECIIQFIKDIKNWVDLTGAEFVVDAKMFRLVHKTKRGD